MGIYKCVASRQREQSRCPFIYKIALDKFPYFVIIIILFFCNSLRDLPCLFHFCKEERESQMARQKGIRLHELDPDRFGPEEDLPDNSRHGSNDDSVVEEEAGLVPSPKLPDVSSTLLADETVADKVREGAEKVRTWVKATLAALSQVARGSRELQEIRAPAVAEAERKLNRFLKEEEMPAYRRAAWLGLFDFEFSQELKNREEVKGLLSRLVAEGRLVETTDGPIKGYKDKADEPEPAYAFSDEAQFGDPEMWEVSSLYRQCRQRAWEATGKARTDEARELMKQSELSVEEFLEGKPGIFTIGIPPEPIVNLTTDSIIAWRGGGTLQVKSDGQKIFPLAATGNIQASVQEAKELKVHLFRDSLSWETPPFIKELPIEMAKKIQLLWHLLQRGLRAAEETRQLQAVKDEMAILVTVTPSEFFLEDKPGICLAEYRGIWEELVPDEEKVNRRPNLFFSVERFSQEGEEGDQMFIRLVQVPDHLGDFFEACSGEYPEGEQFGGCPQPLRAVLRAIYGQTMKAAQLNGKTNG